MAKKVRHYVLVSNNIPRNFDVLALQEDGTIDTGMSNKIIDGWRHRVYEVPNFGSFEEVDVTQEDRFIAQVQGYSLTELNDWPIESGMVGDMRSWSVEYCIFTPNGDFVNISPDAQDRLYRTYEPQRFGLEPYPSWDPDVPLGHDLTEEVFETKTS